MNRAKRNLLVVTSIFFLIYLSAGIHAHCPLCTAATGAAVAATRFYGLDDLIVGIFIGGFVVSTALWFNNILLRRNKGKNYLPYQAVILVLISLLLTLWAFYSAKLIGTTAVMDFKRQIFGIDKLIVGTIIGTVLSLFAFQFSKTLRKWNSGKVLFPFQTIIITLLTLILAGFISWLVTK